MSSSSAPCAACKLQRRKCTPECVFAPHFPADQPHKFAFIHKVFGASNVAKLLNELDISQREDAVNSLAYEAEMRLRDPVYGCVGPISLLNQKLAMLHAELHNARKELATYIGPQALLPMMQPQQAAAFMGDPSGLAPVQYVGGGQTMAGPSGLGSGAQTMAGPSGLGDGGHMLASRSRLLGRGRTMAGPSGLGGGQTMMAGPSGLGRGGHTMAGPSRLGGQTMAGPSGVGNQAMAGPSGMGNQAMAGLTGLGGGAQTVAGPSGQQMFEAQQLAMAAAAREQQEFYRRHQENMNMSGGFDMVAAGAGGSGYDGQGGGVNNVSSSLALGGPFDQGQFEGPFEGQFEENQFQQIQGAENSHPYHHLQAHHLSLQPHQLQQQQDPESQQQPEQLQQQPEQLQQQPLMIEEQEDHMGSGSEEKMITAGPSC